MLQRRSVLKISGWRHLALTLVGSTLFCVYSRSWKDPTRLIYDVPASLAVFSFVARLVLEGVTTGITWRWASCLALLVAMTSVVTGREFLGWPISGHLSCVLAVALAQAGDPRLSVLERLLYWLPLPIIVAVRWSVFDQGQHGQSYAAVVFGLTGGLAVLLVTRISLTRSRPRAGMDPIHRLP
jgi:hypothetical protein